MSDKYISDGAKIVVAAPTGGATVNGIYIGTDYCGVYLETAAAGANVAVAVEGEFELSKDSSTFGVLDKAYATSGGVVTGTASAGTPLGVTTQSATSGTSTVRVKLDRI
ncbi:MAG: DUF2190 family protein [Planctomycetota bacterium]|nr:MAG: DUF2190 family protein [Planctomycetota bacterium]